MEPHVDMYEHRKALYEGTYRCDLCGRLRRWIDGAHDAVERYLAHPDGGVCDSCFSKLPEHVIEAAEAWDAGGSA